MILKAAVSSSVTVIPIPRSVSVAADGKDQAHE